VGFSLQIANLHTTTIVNKALLLAFVKNMPQDDDELANLS